MSAGPPVTEGTVDFDGFETWYRIVGELPAPGAPGPRPLVTLHGGPGATHRYLSSLADLAVDGRAVVFYDQLGNGQSTHLPERGAEWWTVELFARELATLVAALGVDRAGYHVLGQSWGGFLAQEHALTRPRGLRSLVLSNTAASFPAFVAAADRWRAELPAEVEATLRRHEAAGTTGDAEYLAACDVFYRRHLCRCDPWPDDVTEGLAAIDADPTVYHTMNGPSEFHVIGSIRDWSVEDRLGSIDVPTLVISGRYDEAAPDLQDTLVAGIPSTEQVILEESSHLPFWEEREAYMAAVGGWLARHDG
jgi:L-proline amide hydrolase